MPKLPVILASASPRRRELLKQLIPEFEVVPADLDEEAFADVDPRQTATVLALEKARSIAKCYPDHLVIGSDTVVAYEDSFGKWMQLAKPIDRSDATRMLTSLSGRTHSVFTGVALVQPNFESVIVDSTSVTFRDLSQEEIEAYVSTGEPMDKAGAYAIQGGAAQFVEKIEGNISTVVGLPIELLSEMLAKVD